MRKGFEAKILYTNNGNLKAISTGSDACTEHECGMGPVIDQLTSYGIAEAATIAALKKPSGKSVSFPSFLAKKRIVTKHPRLLYQTDSAEAILQLDLRRGTADADVNLRWPGSTETDIVGAWYEQGFAFLVRGKKAVAALHEMYEALQTGKAVFAYDFLPAELRMTGVVLGIEARLDLNIGRRATLQADYEDSLRLKAMDDTDGVLKEMRIATKLENFHFGFLWAVWGDDAKTFLKYRLNPGCNVKADYSGPYTRKELVDWAATRCQYRLAASKLAA